MTSLVDCLRVGIHRATICVLSVSAVVRDMTDCFVFNSANAVNLGVLRCYVYMIQWAYVIISGVTVCCVTL